MPYDLSVKAEEDLVRLYVDGVQRFGVETAERYWIGLQRAFAFLTEHPGAARERLEINPPVRIHPCGSHIIVYIEKEEGEVLILRVRHGREDWISDPL